MKFLLFYHSAYSDWNHGNAHFLRGITKSLQKRGHEVIIYEPENGWSLQNLLKTQGIERLEEFKKYYPTIHPQFYNSNKSLSKKIFKDVDVVIVHEWNSPKLIEEIGNYKEKYGFTLLFHDTHHRAVSDTENLAKNTFVNYDGVLVFGKILKDLYLKNNWNKNVWVWHEAADAEMFHPQRNNSKEGDLVWIGNWGDNERAEELQEYLINPIKNLGIKAKIYGVRYPKEIIKLLEKSGIEYGGWLPNYKVPEIFSKYNLTVHIPRKPYVEQLLGIPTIRPFEAMSCGIPLVSAPWEDTENLFSTNKDYLLAKNPEEMERLIYEVLQNHNLSTALSENGRKVILEKHTCDHRVQELEKIIFSIKTFQKTQIS